MRLWGRGGQPSPMATQKEILLLFACGRVYASSIGRWKEASAQRACLWSPAWTWEEGRLGERAVEIHRGSGKTQASSFHLPCGHPIYAVNLEMINTYCYSKDNFNARRSLESHADAFHAHIPVPAAYSRLGGCSADDCPPHPLHKQGHRPIHLVVDCACVVVRFVERRRQRGPALGK